jgi:hypothetical protein
MQKSFRVKATGSAGGAIIECAQDLERRLETARAIARDWIVRRRILIKQLLEIQETASKLLAELSDGSGPATRHGGRVDSSVPTVADRRVHRVITHISRARGVVAGTRKPGQRLN